MSAGRTAAVLAALTAAGAPAPAHALDTAVRSFDGEPIAVTFHPAEGLAAGERAPTVLQTHGFGFVRSRDADGTTNESNGQVGLGPLRRAGFNVLTWDSRGFGESGGSVQVASPDFEGRDVQALLDWLATQPQALLDGPGDPRVGMQGQSYAGGIQATAAGLDRRIDALAPTTTWHSIAEALNPAGLAKLGWGSALLGVGIPTAATLGLVSPHGVQTGSVAPELLQAAVDVAVLGRFSTGSDAFLRSRGPGALLDRVTIPTLLAQGTPDTLFSPSHALRTYENLRARRVPVKLVWFCGGHGICRTGNVAVVERTTIAWFRRWLHRDAAVDTGPRFEWVADDGRLRTAADHPLSPGPVLRTTGSGTVVSSPSDTLSGLLVAATPGTSGVRVTLPAPPRETEVAGEPELRLVYRGTGLTPAGHLVAQLVDERRNLVVGNQATPIAVTLDGVEHTATVRLAGVAMHLDPASRYRLELLGGSNLFGPVRQAARVDVREATVTLPTGDAARTVDRDTLGLPVACTSRRVFTIHIRAPRGVRLRSADVLLQGRRVARVRGRSLRARIDLRGLPKGTFTVRVVARTPTGGTLEQTRHYRTCRPRR